MSTPNKSDVLMDRDSITLNVVLSCELTRDPVKQVCFKSPPTTPLEVKEKIEEEFSIPACVQTLQYQTVTLRDTDVFQCTQFRHGDTFTVLFPARGDCSRVQEVIVWLSTVFKHLQAIKDYDSHHFEEDNDPLQFQATLCNMAEESILSGMQEGTAQDLCLHLFYPWKEKRTYVNKLHFQHGGGLDVLMKVYGLLVEREWGDLGINAEFHLYLECLCSQAVANYTQTFPLRRQVIQLGGLEMCIKTLLRRDVGREGHEIRPDSLMKSALEIALYAVCNLSELPECQVLLAKNTDVIGQTIALGLHPSYDCKTAIVSASMILCLSQSPGAHALLARSEVIEGLLEMCEVKHKMVIDHLPHPPPEKEEPMSVSALQGYVSIVLAQICLGSPHVFHESISFDLQTRILQLMSTMLAAASPAEISRYEEKEGLVWGTFLPYMQFLYNPLTVADGREETGDNVDGIRRDLHLYSCNVLLHGLENALGRDIHFQILVREKLLDYSMCLPSVLPVDCRERARSLVNELSKHKQLQPPTLCTLTKARMAKAFCGLQAVMEMHSIREFVHKYLSGDTSR